MGKRHSKSILPSTTFTINKDDKVSPRSFTHTGDDYDTTMDAFLDMIKLSLKRQDVCVLHIRENDKPLLRVGTDAYYALDIVKLSKSNGYQISVSIR
jgi:hypothetical protein